MKDCLEVKQKKVVSFVEKLEIEIITVSLSENVDIWSFPVSTVSQSEKAYELNYQSSCVVPLFQVLLNPGEEKTISLAIEQGK